MIIGEPIERGVTSFQADVKVFTEQERVPNSETPLQTYRLSVKQIGGRVYTRLDFDTKPEIGLAARTILSDGTEQVAFETVSGKILYRTALPGVDGTLPPIGEKGLFARIDVPLLRARMLELGYDVGETAGSSLLVVSAPALMLKANSGETVSSYRLYFDAANGTWAGSETVVVEPDGTIVTTTVFKLYRVVNGQPILVGEQRTISHDEPYSIDTTGRMIPALDGPDSARTVSRDELERMRKNGDLLLSIDPVFGDPASPDRVETCFTIYQDIALNTLPDSLFKMP